MRKILNSSSLTSGFVFNIISMIVISFLNIISYRVALDYFGKDLFGIYALLTTFTGYLILANFGVPTAATTLISGHINKSIQKFIINYSFILLLILSIFLFSSLYTIDFNYFSRAIGIDAENSPIFNYCLFISLMGVSLKIPFQLYQSIFLGNQRVAIVRFIDVLLVVSLNLMLYFASKFNIKFIDFYLNYTVITVIITVLAFIFSYKNYLYTSITKIREVKVKIYSLSIGFFLLSLPVTFGWTIDNIIISSYLGIGEVSAYAFSTKIYMFSLAFVSIVPNTLFSFYMRHKKTNGLTYILNLQSFTLMILRLLAGVLALLIFSIDSLIIKLWSESDSVYAGVEFSFIMSFYVYVTALINLHSSFLTGTLNVKRVAILSYLELMTHILLSILLVRYMGLLGIALAMFISSISIPYLLLPKFIDKISKTSFLFDNSKHLFLCFLPAIILIYIQKKYIFGDSLNFLAILISLSYFIFSTIISKKKQFYEAFNFIRLSISGA